MALTDLKLNSSIDNAQNDLVKDFFLPVLNETLYYRRATGYFSSSVLEEVGKAFWNIGYRGGFVRIICSPNLTEEDFDALKKGYENRQEAECFKIINKALLRELDQIDSSKREVLNLLSTLIAIGALDFRIAMTADYGLYHEKFGIMEDGAGEEVAFIGSANATRSALCRNMESIEVYCSWLEPTERKRIIYHKERFERLWKGTEKNLKIFQVPELKREFIQRFKTNENDDLASINWSNIKTCTNKPKLVPDWQIPADLTYYNYQLEAMNSWVKHGFMGIFEMATGTGKTLTALGAMMRLVLRNYESGKGLMVVIACPYQHLVEQWVEDLVRFGIKPIVGYSGAPDSSWFSNLERKVTLAGRINATNCHYSCFITTNATLMSTRVKNQLLRLKKNGETLFIVDEAHNAGALGFRRALEELGPIFSYRLALSATPSRHYDDEGTEFIKKYFGETCISYDLRCAIRDGKLTPYEYYPILVSLNSQERQKYVEITVKMQSCLIKGADGQIKLNSYGQMLAIERSRLIAGVAGKLEALKELVINNKLYSSRDLLVYCGAVSNELLSDQNNSSVIRKDGLTNYEAEELKGVADGDLDTSVVVEKQIRSVTRMLGNEFHMKVASFTAINSREERQSIINSLASGDLQAVVAIKCLDEGVNIPSVRTAVIMASTTNPKEYIQRRGRVLRLYPGKTKAVIYDLLTMPYNFSQMMFLTKTERQFYKSLVFNELKRSYEFAQLSLNKCEGVKEIENIARAFDIKMEELED